MKTHHMKDLNTVPNFHTLDSDPDTDTDTDTGTGTGTVEIREPSPKTNQVGNQDPSVRYDGVIDAVTAVLLHIVFLV